MAEMEYTIDLGKNILNCEFSGYISAEELIHHIMTIREDPDFHMKLNTIADLRKASLARGAKESKKVADFLEKTSKERGAFKLALIAKFSDVDSVNSFTVFTQPGCVKLCSKMKEAEEWVLSDR